MEILLANRTLEARGGSIERLHDRRVARLGSLAIRADQLGVNDPLTHVYQYIERGYESLPGIKEDIETDIAERLPNTPFVNTVDFNFSGDDFISVKDKVSMRAMTETNLEILASESRLDTSLVDEYERAKLESTEVTKLGDWFSSSPVGSVMVFESLPIGQQEYAVARIYQKTSDSQLAGNFISLHNPSIKLFEQVRLELGVPVPSSTHHTALDILGDEYCINGVTEGFVNKYVQTYDGILNTETGQNHSFGLQSKDVVDNGISKVRRQTKLTSIYVDAVRAISSGQGRVTSELIDITNNLDNNRGLVINQPLTVELIRTVLENIAAGIASVVHRADGQLLRNLESDRSDQDTNLASISHYSGQAKSEGATYSNTGCPTVGRNNQASESNGGDMMILGAVFNLLQSPDNFGRPKIGVCRISNCPSRGELSWWHKRTLVGGCDICVDCHKIFEKGKLPQNVYQKQQAKKLAHSKIAA